MKYLIQEKIFKAIQWVIVIGSTLFIYYFLLDFAMKSGYMAWLYKCIVQLMSYNILFGFQGDPSLKQYLLVCGESILGLVSGMTLLLYGSSIPKIIVTICGLNEKQEDFL